MKLFQMINQNGDWTTTYGNPENSKPDIVLCFASKSLIIQADSYKHIRSLFPDSAIVISSTSGEISNNAVHDYTFVATGITLSQSSIIAHIININETEGSYAAGTLLAQKFNTENLRLLFVLSDGQLVNGSDLVQGLNDTLESVPIVGGLAGDGADFQSTLVGLNDDIEHGNITAIGFYGDSLRIGAGSKGGWDNFGPMRTITKSDKNILYEIDGENALDLYVKYLGDYAEQLPGSALLFPIAIQDENNTEVVRTILSIDTENKTMTFAGNLPEGTKVRLMKANLDNLAAAAADAADLSNINTSTSENKLAILISCVGRKLIFGSRIDEEIEAARDIVGEDTVITGFYSYGEIAPFSTFMKCELHNQTMTITTICEE